MQTETATGNKVTLNAENSWTAKFAAVDVKKDGTRIKYEVKRYRGRRL